MTRAPLPFVSLMASARRKAFQLKYGVSENELSDAIALTAVNKTSTRDSIAFFTLVSQRIYDTNIALHDDNLQFIEYSAI
jgi:hypothetical protein